VTTVFSTRSMVAAGAALALSVLPTAASAATILFNLTSQSISTSGSGSSAIKFTTATVGGVKVRISAWTLSGTSGSGTIAKSTLAQYSSGLGAVSSGESTSNNTHTIDNQYSRDFLLFQFDQSVSLTSGKLTPFAVGGSSTDTDFTVGRGTSATPWTTQMNLTGTTSAGLSTLLTGGLNHYNGPSSTTIASLNPSGGYGNVWIIGAKFTNTGTFDAFKFSALKVSTALPVPESSTWMMMIVGFGAVGATMRRKKAVALAAVA
jgi:hypothetical protein